MNLTTETKAIRPAAKPVEYSIVTAKPFDLPVDAACGQPDICGAIVTLVNVSLVTAQTRRD